MPQRAEIRITKTHFTRKEKAVTCISIVFQLRLSFIDQRV